MKQLIQNFKTGSLLVDDVPPPSLGTGMVLVQNRFSLISAGTERSTVKVAQAGLIGKARLRPDLVAQVLQNVKKEGLAATINKVRNKLDSLKALGYSTSGVVLASLDKDGKFKPGDRVACAGQDYASHAEIVSVPQNLVVHIPEQVSFEEAAFTTIGAIALQGVRQADVKLGEKVCVIGLGLLGQLTSQLLKANGCEVLGIDLNDHLVQLANECAGIAAFNRKEQNLTSACENFTSGHGFDAVIITAATDSNNPIELAGALARKKGKVIVVGAVKMDIPREPDYYKKELDIRMSCSYGPGRYDASYEYNGIDYPYAYVRWTEQRNMEAFLALVSRKAIQLHPLITHVFALPDALPAYDIILGKNPVPHVGILLQYKENFTSPAAIVHTGMYPLQAVNTGFIGAGNFAQHYLIPEVKRCGCSLMGVVTSKGITAKNVATKFKFNYCSSDSNDVLNDERIDTVFIATPHAAHADLVIRAMKKNKNVFVEKPLAISMTQLHAVIQAKKEWKGRLMVGFNRRFSPVCTEIKKRFEYTGEPLVMHMRINAGFIPKDHWTQQAEIGGGRIVGEICHFIDLMQYFSNAEPVSVFADCIDSRNEKRPSQDNIAIIIRFNDGSVGNIVYTANGDHSMPKERIEISGGGQVGVIDDFKTGTFFKNNRSHKITSKGKGHKEEIAAFCDAIRSGKESPVSFRSLCLTTLTTLSIMDSLYTALPQTIHLDVF